jgi:hypothetical protein
MNSYKFFKRLFFKGNNGPVRISGDIKGVPKGKHGIHVCLHKNFIST